MLSFNSDPKKVEEIEKKISYLLEKKNDFSKKQLQLEENNRELQMKIEELRSNRSNLMTITEQVGRVASRLKAFRDQLHNIQDIDMEIAHKKHVEIIEKCVNTKAQIMLKIIQSVPEYSKILKNILLLNAKKLALDKSISKLKNNAEGKLAEKATLTEMIENLVREEKKLNEQYNSLASDLHHKMKDLKIKSNDLQNVTSDEEEIDIKVAEFQARAELQAREVDDIEKNYEDAVKNLERIQDNFTSKSYKLESFVSNNKEKKENWNAEITDVIQTISSDFGELMSYLNCAGEVNLSKPTDENDYENYGISIKVKFRDNEELMGLSSKRQSGGERAVSTVLFMLSLQKLTSAPFRVVDEINQGMDSTNERKVYELLIKHVCSPSQYFMLTPKLLPELDYPTNIKFFCVQKAIRKFGLPYDTLSAAYERFLQG